jgi:membrane-associated phospholipid phosphatase
MPRQTAALVWRALTRRYHITPSMLLLAALVPLYVVIAEHAGGGVTHAPRLPLDERIPVVPAWSLVYGMLYLFLILLPVVVIQQEELIRRTVRAYLGVWIVAYACFLLFPTVAPRPEEVPGAGFAAWGLRFLYDADPPHNCFPSLHVAHSLVGALACQRVHPGLGRFALVCAGLVAVSVLFTRQHYVADVVFGVLLALVACGLAFRSWSPQHMPAHHRDTAPWLALPVAGIVALASGVFWVIYRWFPGFPW